MVFYNIDDQIFFHRAMKQSILAMELLHMEMLVLEVLNLVKLFQRIVLQKAVHYQLAIQQSRWLILQIHQIHGRKLISLVT